MINFSHIDLHDRLEDVRSSIGESKAEFYGNSGAGRSLPDNLLKGSWPSIDKIISLSEHTGCSVDFLLGREEQLLPKSSEGKWRKALDQLSDESRTELEHYLDYLLWKQAQEAATSK